MQALQNLRVNTSFQNQTIQQLTSGYRINSSGDDPAGLAVANGYRNNVAELSQGVSNANDGLSQLQIIDGGLSNISQILDRMKTLATQSASTTFTGDRATLNDEYQSLVSEINRQAANVGLNTGGTYNNNLAVYVGGGGSVQSNSIVNVDLSGSTNAADANALGLTGTTLLSGGTDFIADSVNLNSEQGPALLGGAANTTQTFTVNLAGGTAVTARITSGTAAGGITVANAVQQLNDQLASSGITASVDQSTGMLMFTGNAAFTASAGAATHGTGLVSNNATVQNSAMHIANGAATFGTAGTIAASDSETFTVTNSVSGKAATVTLNAGTTTAQAAAQLNTNLAAVGVNAVINSAGTGIDLQSAQAFTVSKPEADDTAGGAAGVFADSSGGGGGGGGGGNGAEAVNDLNTPGAMFDVGTGQETFDVSYIDADGGVSSQTISVQGTAQGLDKTTFLNDINGALSDAGITNVDASADASTGALEFTGSNFLQAIAGTTGSAPTSLAVQSGATLLNGADDQATGAFQAFVDGGDGMVDTELVNITEGGSTNGLDLGFTLDNAAAASLLNVELPEDGIDNVWAVGSGNNLTLEGTGAFSLAEKIYTAGGDGGNVQFSGTSGNESILAQVAPFINNDTEYITITPPGGGSDINLTLNSSNADNWTDLLNTFNTALSGAGISATQSGGQLKLTASSPFNLSNVAYAFQDDPTDPNGGSGSWFGTTVGNSSAGQALDVTAPATADWTGGAGGVGSSGGGGGGGGNGGAAISVNAPTASANGTTGNALTALTAVTNAVSNLGLVQGNVGAGENKLNYAINLAESQITNFSSAESDIRDADVATEAANLTKAQVLQQTTMAAMAQANSAPQQVLTLLRQ